MSDVFENAVPAKADSYSRLPPNSEEGEKGVLACILQAPEECMPDAVACLRASAFYDLKNRTLYEILVDMYTKGLHIDVITLTQYLKDRNALEAVGGIATIATLPDYSPSATGLTHYAKIVRDKFVLRRLIQTGTEIVSTAYSSPDTAVDATLDAIETKVLQIGSEMTVEADTGIREAVLEATNIIEQMASSRQTAMGIPTGFVDLDNMIGGLAPGDLIILAARPSIGKTSLAMNIVENVCVKKGSEGVPVGVFSLEMRKTQLILRTLGSMADVNVRKIGDGETVDWAKIGEASTVLSSAPLYIDDTGGLNVMQIRARARRMFQRHGIKLLVIDYLSLIATDRHVRQNRSEVVGMISNSMKQLAKDLSIPVIVLAQLNRELEKDKNRRPRLSDLRESGTIEADADLCLMLYNAGENEKDSDLLTVGCYIAKHRNGPTGEVQLMFDKTRTRYYSKAPVGAEDVPVQEPRQQTQQQPDRRRIDIEDGDDEERQCALD